MFIKWVDRTVSKVKPQELYKVDTEVMYSVCNVFTGVEGEKIHFQLMGDGIMQ